MKIALSKSFFVQAVWVCLSALLLQAEISMAQPCATFSKVLFSQDFGSGTGLSAAPPAPVPGSGVVSVSQSTAYSASVTQPLAVEAFTFSNNARNANNNYFASITDHTGNTNGRMFIINANVVAKRMYTGNFTHTLCANQRYSISFYAAFPGNAAYATLCAASGGFVYPRVKIRVRDGFSGVIISEISTADITSNSWQQYGLSFVSATSHPAVIFDLINDAPGGCGNDIILDDVKFGSCDPTPVVGVNSLAGCIGETSTFSGGLLDPTAIPGTKEYQWQVAAAPGGPWVNIAGATSQNYTISPVTLAQTEKYYRMLVSAQGNIANANCRFTSTPTLLSGKVFSTEATGIIKGRDNVCAGLPVTLSLSGGSLGTNATWNWFEGSCGGAFVNTGTNVEVNPLVTTTYYVRAEGDCNATECFPVTLFVTCNIDKDNDGIPDYVESYIPASLLDDNSNGIPNAFDPLYPGYSDYNNDYINDDFQADGDSDNDGILNYLDTGFPGRLDTNADGIDDRFDTDLDGIISMLDRDSDNDGITDVIEAGGEDANGDGHIDNFTDTDADGLSQNVDDNSSGAGTSGTGLGAPDFDGDGKPNAIDSDSDGDGIPDVVEAGGPDANNDAKIDGFTDVNNDGLADNYANASALLHSGADLNNDGRADSYPFKNFDNDKRPDCYDVDSDDDGIADVIEAGFADNADYNGFIDGAISDDGWNTALHALPALNLLNSDGEGKPNYLDIDSDADGIPDNIEGQTTAGYRFPAYADADSDGLDNAYDLAPFAATFGGSGIFLSDKDLDGMPDYTDLDTDSDGAPDIKEGHDYDVNGIADENVTPTGMDTDGDGLDDRFDLINSGTYLKGTSILMGTGGSLTGDPAPGTRATVQKYNTGQPERDWRYISYVLPIKYLQLSCSENKGNVTLAWEVISSAMLDVFEIERSTDNIHFQKFASRAADMPLDKLTRFMANDNISEVNSGIFFYRIKVKAKNGEAEYSNVVMLRKTAAKALLSIFPNPANDAASVNFYSAKDAAIIISIKNNVGQTVFTQKQQVHKGSNKIAITSLNKYPAGVYSVQVLIDEEWATARLMILN